MCESYSGDDQLGRICEAGNIIVSTDPAYPPQSSLNSETGEYEGFDIDVANEIGARLGVTVEFTDPPFDAVQGGNWSDRWDMSVGSVTITETRQEVLDFTQPYYFTPAQMATTDGTGIESLEDFSGTTVCVAEGTTYFDWLEGTLTLTADAGEVTDPPADITSTTLPTDINCAEAWQAGRSEFEGWLSSSTTVQGAIDEGYPVVAVGDPVFFEPLAVCFDILGRGQRLARGVGRPDHHRHARRRDAGRLLRGLVRWARPDHPGVAAFARHDRRGWPRRPPRRCISG